MKNYIYSGCYRYKIPLEFLSQELPILPYSLEFQMKCIVQSTKLNRSHAIKSSIPLVFYFP